MTALATLIDAAAVHPNADRQCRDGVLYGKQRGREGYDCNRVQDTNTVGRILPRITERIDHSAFVIVDLTERKSNVFFELGYAEASSKMICAPKSN